MSTARVGLIAVSGVRVYNERLIRLGVTRSLMTVHGEHAVRLAA